MNVKEAIALRRSVKQYDKDHQMASEEIEELLNMAILSPTAFNIQNWRFLVVSDPDLRQKIREVSMNQAQITEASLLIIICADINAWEKAPERYYADVPDQLRNFFVELIDDFYQGKDQLQRDEAMRSSGIVAQTLMLAAKSMGYDSCPMVGFEYDKVAELINLPEDHVIGMLLALGKPLVDARPRSGQLALDEVVINNKF